MPVPSLPIAIRLHRYGFLVTADLNSAGLSLARLRCAVPANDGGQAADQFSSRERELFRQFTEQLRGTPAEPQTNLRFFPRSSPVSPASFAAALWGLPFTARAVLVLVCVEGFSLAEAAFIVDLPMNRAANFMDRGLAMMGTDSG